MTISYPIGGSFLTIFTVSYYGSNMLAFPNPGSRACGVFGQTLGL